jgi:hypothetical protein
MFALDRTPSTSALWNFGGLRSGRLTVRPEALEFTGKIGTTTATVTLGGVGAVSRRRFLPRWVGLQVDFDPRSVQVTVHGGMTKELRKEQMVGYYTLWSDLARLLILVERMPPVQSRFIYELLSQVEASDGRPYGDRLKEETHIELRTAGTEIRSSAATALALARELWTDYRGTAYLGFRPFTPGDATVAEAGAIVELWKAGIACFRLAGRANRANEEKLAEVEAAIAESIAARAGAFDRISAA